MNNKTIVNFLLDETGSMTSVKDATISGFNEYVKTLQKEKGKITMSLTKFNSTKVEVVYTDKDIKQIEELNNKTYMPDNLTPLYDAIGKTINEVKTKLEKQKDKPKVLFIIMTDGLENASKEYTQIEINKLIKEGENNKWTFIYLGADHDSWTQAQKFGIARGNTMDFDKTKIKAMMCSLGERSAGFASSGGFTRRFFK